MEKEPQYTHRVYGKLKTAKQFKPFDLRNVRQVTNLIYASMLPESEATEQVKFMNENNPDWVFEARKI